LTVPNKHTARQLERSKHGQILGEFKNQKSEAHYKNNKHAHIHTSHYNIEYTEIFQRI